MMQNQLEFLTALRASMIQHLRLRIRKIHVLFQQASQKLEERSGPSSSLTCFRFGEGKALCVEETLN